MRTFIEKLIQNNINKKIIIYYDEKEIIPLQNLLTDANIFWVDGQDFKTFPLEKIYKGTYDNYSHIIISYNYYRNNLIIRYGYDKYKYEKEKNYFSFKEFMSLYRKEKING